jgi:hypothetical protein
MASAVAAMPVSRRKSPEPNARRNAPWALAMLVGFLDADGGFHQRDHGCFAVHAVEAFGDLVRGFGLGKHHAEQARGAAEACEVVGPEGAGGIVDADPGLAAGGQPVDDVVPGMVLLRGVHGIFNIQDDRVSAGDCRLVKKLRLHGIHEEPGAGDLCWDIAFRPYGLGGDGRRHVSTVSALEAARGRKRPAREDQYELNGL